MPETSHAAAISRPGLLRGLWVVVMAASVAGLGLSAVLMMQSLATGPRLPGCGAGSGCDQLLSGPYARVLGEPVATFALAAWLLATLLAGSAMGRWQRMGPVTWRIVLVLAGLMLAAAIYFTLVQALVLGAWCLYCMLAHTAGVIFAIAVLWAGHLVAPAAGLARRTALGCVGVGVVAVIALAAIQHVSPGPNLAVIYDSDLPDTDTGPGADREITLLGQRIRLQPHQHPILGNPDAPVVMLELFDYACAHCRLLHGDLATLRQRYGDQLAIVSLPTPIHPQCNPQIQAGEMLSPYSCELAVVAMAVFLSQREKFEAVHHDLMRFERDGQPAAPTGREALALAVAHVPDLETSMQDPALQGAIVEQINKHTRLHSLLGGAMPTVVVGHALFAGRPPDIALLESYLTATPAAQRVESDAE